MVSQGIIFGPGTTIKPARPGQKAIHGVQIQLRGEPCQLGGSGLWSVFPPVRQRDGQGVMPQFRVALLHGEGDSPLRIFTCQACHQTTQGLRLDVRGTGPPDLERRAGRLFCQSKEESRSFLLLLRMVELSS